MPQKVQRKQKVKIKVVESLSEHFDCVQCIESTCLARQGEAHLAVVVFQSFDELNRDCLVGPQRNEQWVFVFVCCGILMVASNATLLRF